MTPEVTSRRLVTTAAAAMRTGLSASTLTKLRLTGGGPAYVKLGAAVRYDLDLVDEWLAKRVRHSTSEGLPDGILVATHLASKGEAIVDFVSASGVSEEVT